MVKRFIIHSEVFSGHFHLSLKHEEVNSMLKVFLQIPCPLYINLLLIDAVQGQKISNFEKLTDFMGHVSVNPAISVIKAKNSPNPPQKH